MKYIIRLLNSATDESIPVEAVYTRTTEGLLRFYNPSGQLVAAFPISQIRTVTCE